MYTHNSTRKKDALAALAVVLATAAIFALLFDRESTLSYSIGYNLYGAERILAGEVPYRDFHTLYPPATVYANAALFLLLGITLYTALLGVLVFKVLTTLFIYLCGVHLMPRAWALLAALSSVIWLRPNGPFKAVPMHYGALFLVLALYFGLHHQRSRKWGHLFACGAMLGALALFKHNIATYALLGFLTVAVVDARRADRRARGPLLMLAGMALPVIPVVLYMQLQGALLPMLKTLLFGPGDFLLSRLAAAPGARVPALCLVLLGAVFFAAYKLRAKPAAASAILAGLLILVTAFCLGAGQSAIDEIVFYAPVFVLAAGAISLGLSIKTGKSDLVLLLVLTSAAAAFLESFPRFAREQAIAAMPFVTLLMLFLLHRARDTVRSLMPGAVPRRAAAAILPLVFFLMGGRILFNTYFDRSFHFKS
ncbi:MAG TPA: glycosyltransferase family 39 protein, partial [Blastocatellia bacterium]|nr:glycosyltransferase family 39 protein [Blastocatellia bacterium]